jgi:geranylgeranylglycerol-phosphate geranylgeranyltransferase
MSLKHFFLILRPLNCLIASFAAWLGFVLSIQEISFNFKIFLAMISVFLICGAGQTINDFFDLKIDLKIKPKKILPQKKISPIKAYYYSLFLFAFASFLSFFINLTAFIIAIVFSVLLYSYSAFFSNYKFLGNWLVAAGTSFTLIFGATLSNNFFLPGILAIAALFANAFREIIKDFEDTKGDKGLQKTLPQMISKNSLNKLLLILILIAIFTGFIPLIFKIFSSAWYVFLITISAVFFIYSYALFYKNSFKKAQNLSKIGMILALMAFLTGIL